MHTVIFAINISTFISTLDAKFDTTENHTGHTLLVHRQVPYRLGYLFSMPEECEIPYAARRKPQVGQVHPTSFSTGENSITLGSFGLHNCTFMRLWSWKRE